MSIAAATADHYIGDGTSTTFTANFRILTNSEIVVLLNGTVQVYGSQYSLSGVGNATTQVVMFTAPPDTIALTLMRNQPISQLSAYTPNEAYNPVKTLNDLDRAAMVDQMLAERIGRAPKFLNKSTNVDIPMPEPAADQFLGWNTSAPWEIENKEFVPADSVVASNSDPEDVAGDAASGVSSSFSRADHVHRDMGHRFSVLDYGADPTGVADSATAFANTRTAAIASGEIFPEIFIPIGSYSISTSLNANNVRYIGQSMYSTIIYQTTSATAVNGVFRADGTVSLTTTIVGAVAKGARTITLTSAAGYAIGDLIMITNTEAAIQAVDGSSNAFSLLTRVMDLTGAVVTLLDPLPFAIGLTDAEAVVKVTPTTTQIANLTINGTFNTGQAPFGNNAIVVFYSQEVRIENVNTLNYTKGYGIFLWGSYNSQIINHESQNCGDTVGFGAALGTFDCTGGQFSAITARWPSRDGMVFSRNSYCQYDNLLSVRAAVRNVKFHGCRQCVASNITGNNAQGGTGLAFSGGTADSVFTNITTTGNKGPNASGNQNGVWFADMTDTNNVLSNVNSWDNGDWDIAVFSTDIGTVVNGGRFSSATKILNQGHKAMFNITLDDVLSGGLTSVSMVSTTAAGTVGPSHRLHRHFSTVPSAGDLMGQYVFAGNNSLNALVEYAKMYALNSNYNTTAEAATIAFSAFQAGVNAVELQIGGGLVVGAPIGGAKGVGTVNATAVYDDNAILTDYVFEGKKHGRFDPKYLDAATYTAYWRTHGHLPSFPSREEWEQARKPLGDLVQRLWETVEMQAVHIAELLEKIKL
jgi:hypothetical protein